jgi:hypothetical protein
LQYGFWNFYANYFPQSMAAVSIRMGGAGMGTDTGINIANGGVAGGGTRISHNDSHGSPPAPAPAPQPRRLLLLKTVFPKARFWRICIEDPFETFDNAVYRHDLGMHIELGCMPRITRALREAVDVMDDALLHMTKLKAGGKEGSGKNMHMREATMVRACLTSLLG